MVTLRLLSPGPQEQHTTSLHSQPLLLRSLSKHLSLMD